MKNPDDDNKNNQIKILTEENKVLKTENDDQKEEIKKLQINSDSKDKIIADLFFTVIDKQLKDMQEVKLDYVTKILENMAVTDRENSLNRKDENGDIFLHRLIKISRANGCNTSMEEYVKDWGTDSRYNYEKVMISFPDRYRGNYHKLIESLLVNGANADSKTKDGKSCLHLATEEKYTCRHDDYKYFQNPVIIKLLLKYGADANLVDDSTGNTALHHCLFGFTENVVNLLVDHGADCNALTRNGKPVIQLATIKFCNMIFNWNVFEVRCKIIISLWEGGADASVLNKNGDTLLHLLCSDIGYEGFGLIHVKFKNKISNFFKQYNMLNAQNSSGDTPVFCALNYNGGRGH